MDMGGGSCSEDRGFESRRRVLDGHDFFTLICCKNCNGVCMKRPKKMPGLAHFLKKVLLFSFKSIRHLETG